MNTFENLQEHKNGRITVEIGGKQAELRYTVHQMQQLEAKFAARLETGAAKGLTSIAEDDIDICEIALNPRPDVIDFTRDEIKASLDLDRIKVLSQYWLEKKVFSPEFGIEKRVENSPKN